MKGGAWPEINPWGPYACSSAMQPLTAHPCHPSQVCSGMQSLFWLGIGFAKIKETLCGGQPASASQEIKAALEVIWAWRGPRVLCEWASWGHRRRLHILGTRELMINAPTSTLWARCAGLLVVLIPYTAACLSLGLGVIQCNRYTLQNYLSTAQQLHKQGRKTLLEYLKSSTGSFKPLANASGWHLILCIKKQLTEPPPHFYSQAISCIYCHCKKLFSLKLRFCSIGHTKKREGFTAKY